MLIQQRVYPQRKEAIHAVRVQIHNCQIIGVYIASELHSKIFIILNTRFIFPSPRHCFRSLLSCLPRTICCLLLWEYLRHWPITSWCHIKQPSYIRRFRKRRRCSRMRRKRFFQILVRYFYINCRQHFSTALTIP